MIGYSFAFTGDANKAMVAAGRVFQLIDRQTLIDANSSDGHRSDINGNIILSLSRAGPVLTVWCGY